METEESIPVRNEYTGAEPFLAGIAPSYWAHVPMTVADILYHVELKNGINCRMIMTTMTMIRRHNYNNNNNTNKVMSIPVSKCLIVGYIVHTTIRSSDGSNTFVIDDGTGLIDCLQWSNNHHSPNTPEDIYHLPNLMLKNDYDDDNDHEEETFQIGDLVRVYGKLKCLAETVDRKKNDNNNDTADDRSTKPRIIREIVVTAMEKVATVPKKKNKKKRPHPYSSSSLSSSLDAEARHWMKCFETNDANDNKEEEGSSSLSSASSSFHSYLHDLGPKIQSQVSRKMHLPSADDDTAAWRVFGPNCTCDLPYMSNLLYCHCQAKVITTTSSSIPPMRMPQRWNKQKQASSSMSSLSSFDPNFFFRDAVLNVLLEWQSKEVKRLVFEYRKIKTHPKLIQVASQVVASTTTTGTGTGATTPASSTTTATTATTTTTTTTNRHRPIDNTIYIDRLFRNTFSALRQDGIVYLQDPDTDLYLLITREKVLEPHVRNELKRLQKEKEEREKAEKEREERQRKQLEGQDQEEEEGQEKHPPTSNTTTTNNNNNYHHYYKNKNYVNIQDVECLSKVHQERLCYIRRCLED